MSEAVQVCAICWPTDPIGSRVPESQWESHQAAHNNATPPKDA